MWVTNSKVRVPQVLNYLSKLLEYVRVVKSGKTSTSFTIEIALEFCDNLCTLQYPSEQKLSVYLHYLLTQPSPGRIYSQTYEVILVPNIFHSPNSFP